MLQDDRFIKSRQGSAAKIRMLFKLGRPISKRNPAAQREVVRLYPHDNDMRLVTLKHEPKIWI